MAAAASETYGPPVPSPPRPTSQHPSSLPRRPTAAFGAYRVVAELARGGMGVVYRVRHEATGQDYALKTVVVEAGGAGHAEAVLRFQREAEALARVEHPHVVRVHAADLTHDPPYLVQTLLPGGSLADRLRTGPLAPPAAAAVMAKVSRAMHHAHQRGVVHRDLKPENILFDDRGEPRVVDLGLTTAASSTDRLTRTGELMGTPAYMAPEQARGDRADARSDIHALGACLWAALVGRPPHQGGNVVAILESVLSRVPPPPSQEVEGVPPALDAIVARALAPEPGARFPDAGALALALERFAAGDRAPGRAARPRRRPFVVAAVLAGALGLVGLGLAARRPAPDVDEGPVPRSTEPAPPTPASPAGPLEAALATLAAHGPADAAAVASLLHALAPGSRAAPPEETRTAEDMALEAALAAGGVSLRERQAALATLREAPRGPLGAPLVALLDAVAARAQTSVAARDGLLAAAGLVEPLPGHPARLQGILGRSRALSAELGGAMHSLFRDPRVPGRLRALVPLLRALRRLQPGETPYEGYRPDAVLFHLVVQLDALSDGSREELAAWVASLLPLFPDDPALSYAALRGVPLPEAQWRVTADRLARTLVTLASLPPSDMASSIHGRLVNLARVTLQMKDNPGLLALLRREVGSPHAAQVVNLRLLESLSYARGSPDEARAALARLARLGGEVPEYAGFFHQYLEVLAPSWFEALPAAARPRLPLPRGMFFGARPGSYVLFGGEPGVAGRLPDGLELVWLPRASLAGGRLVEGFFLGRADVTLAQLGAAGVRAGSDDAPARGLTWAEADGFLRSLCRNLRLPTRDEVEAATRAGAAAPPLLLGGPHTAPPDPDAGLRVALDGP